MNAVYFFRCQRVAVLKQETVPPSLSLLVDAVFLHLVFAGHGACAGHGAPAAVHSTVPCGL